jgi:hypothetical protein
MVSGQAVDEPSQRDPSAYLAFLSVLLLALRHQINSKHHQIALVTSKSPFPHAPSGRKGSHPNTTRTLIERGCQCLRDSTTGKGRATHRIGKSEDSVPTFCKARICQLVATGHRSRRDIGAYIQI